MGYKVETDGTDVWQIIILVCVCTDMDISFVAGDEFTIPTGVVEPVYGRCTFRIMKISAVACGKSSNPDRFFLSASEFPD